MHRDRETIIKTKIGVCITRRTAMTLCPIALLIGCKKCPVFAICPVKGVIGDYRPPAENRPKEKDGPKPGATSQMK